MFFCTEFSAGTRPTQGKPEDRNLGNNKDFFDFFGPIFPPKKITVTTQERPNLQVEVKDKTYYSLKTMATKFLKIWTGGKHSNAPAKRTNILCQVQKKRKVKLKALMELIKEEKNGRSKSHRNKM